MAFDPSPDVVADCVLDKFDALPRKYKPRMIADGRREWVPLAGIVLSQDDDPTSLSCVALATGMKCLPQNKISLAKGNVIHDWHAEVLAIRAFNRWVLDGCKVLVESGKEKDAWLEWDRHAEEEGVKRGRRLFGIRDGVRIHMYCSEAPCGDASMELTMLAQEDATPWERQQQGLVPPSATTADGDDGGRGGGGEEDMLGRGYFDQLGIVRRKPARSDAPPTLSKSCSDKLALKQCTGLLSGPASGLVRARNVYIKSLVLPESQCVKEGVERAWSERGRMMALKENGIQERWKEGGYRFQPFEIRTTTREFAFSRRQNGAVDGKVLVPSNLSAVWTPRRQEVLINGVLQGRKQFEGVKAASCLARRSIWATVVGVASLAGLEEMAKRLGNATYGDFKKDVGGVRDEVKKDAKQLALKGWKANNGDEDWSLDEPK